MLRARCQNLFDTITVKLGGEYWNKTEFHTDDEDDGTSPLLFSPVQRTAQWNCVVSVMQSMIVVPVGLTSAGVLAFPSGQVTGMSYVGLSLMVIAAGMSVKLAIDGIRWTQLLATMDADGVYDDIFDNGSGIGPDNEDEEYQDDDEENGQEEEPEPEEEQTVIQLRNQEKW